ncbi:hypothetical protein OS493_037613 [Desmophyllum pertusum]|uniref:Uncharacterized protein n=1 Tax=Desmophyllum pertusum TaxID=174260 RepID=A0A9W9ZIF1_9CNID|nr:hypothetical protein OS493_037613 [Desmophyllum pertusum]
MDYGRLDDVFGNKVGVPLGSKKFFAKHSYGVDSLTEYSTESELLKSLQNDAMEKIWLLATANNKTKYANNFMIVDVLEDIMEAPGLGVQIQMVNRTKQDENFTECLKNWSRKMEDAGAANLPTIAGIGDFGR